MTTNILQNYSDFSRLEDVFQNWEFSLTDFHKYIFKKDDSINLFRDEIVEKIHDSQMFYFTNNGEVTAFTSVEYMEWESQMLNCKVGKINFIIHSKFIPDVELNKIISELILYSKNEGFNMIYVKINTKNIKVIRALNDHRFYLTDTSLDFVTDLNRDLPNNINTSLHIEKANETHLDESLAMIEKSFQNHFGRFNNDPRICNYASDIYKNWIKSSFGGYADLILIGKINERVAGLTIWKYKSKLEKKHDVNLGHYSIGAVHPDFYGNKVFHDLTLEGMRIFKNKSHDFIEGPTNIANYPVQNSYSRMGWKNLSSKHCFHLWLS